MNNRQAHLDVLRGLAALMVCAGHLRAFLLVDSARVLHPGPLSKVFYFFTGLGHQCVVVFFVLSGFFVGGGVLKAFASGRWSWLLYGIRRLSRLWIVLLPALVLTLVLDQAGRHLAPAGYHGAYRSLYNSGPALNEPADWSLSAFLGNVFFLQGIATPVFGSNGPLWSLANEFWYYLLFPLMLGVFKLSKLSGKICSFGLVIVLGVFLPAGVLLAGLIWLLGVGVYLVCQNSWCRSNFSRTGCLIISGVLALGSLVTTKISLVCGTDYVVGLAFAFFITCVAVRRNESAGYERFAFFIGETSYTLYLAHFPFLTLLFFTCYKGQKIQPDLAGAMQFLALLVAVLIYTTLVWWCFERNTDRVRRSLEARFQRNVY